MMSRESDRKWPDIIRQIQRRIRSAKASAFLGLASVLLTVVGCRLSPPDIPSLVSSADTTYQRATVAFQVTTVAPGYGDVRYVLDWGDGTIDTTLPWCSGDTAEASHMWQDTGEYRVRAMALLAANTGRASDWSGPETVRVLQNGIPAVPELIAPGRAVPNGLVLFRATTADPDGDSIAFCFDFGDTVGAWTPFVVSGATGLDSHRYATVETVLVRCKAKDKKGSESEWSESETLAVVSGLGAVLWWWRAGDYVMSPVVVSQADKDILYFSTGSCAFYCVDAADGSVLHHAYQLDPGLETWFNGPPAFCEATGHVYVGNQDGWLYCFSQSLALPWYWPEYEDLGDWGAPAVVGNRLYVSRGADTLYCFADLGDEARVENLRRIVRVGESVIADVAGNVLAVSDSGYLYKFSAGLDSLLWGVTLSYGSCPGPPALGSDATVFCGTEDGEFYAVSSGGDIIWQQSLGSGNAYPVVGDEAVFVATDSGGLVALDPQTGSTLWSANPAPRLYGCPVLTANGLVYAYGDDEEWCLTLYCVRRQTGSIVWTCRCGDYGARSRKPNGRSYSSSWNYYPSLAVTSAGSIIVPDCWGVYCVAGYPDGTLDTQAPWPKWQHDPHNTGCVLGR